MESFLKKKALPKHRKMALESIVKGIGRYVRNVAASGLIGLTALGAGYTSANAQQQEYTPANVVEINCDKKTNWGQLINMYGIVFGGVGALRGNTDAQILGGVVSGIGGLEHQKEVAREGRSQVTVNQGQAQPTTVYVFSPKCSYLQDVALAAKTYQDLNDDGGIGLDEFIGIQDKFPDDGENVRLAFYNPSHDGTLSLNLYDSDGNRITEKNFPNSKKRTITFFDLDMDWFGENKIYGPLTAAWNIKDKKGKTKASAVNRFQIIPSLESRRNTGSSGSSATGRNIQFFASYPWKDDGDGYGEFPEEFPENRRREFFADERIIFVMYDPMSQGIQRKIGWKIYNPDGKVSASDSINTNTGNMLIGQEGDYNLTEWLLENGGPGIHKIKWSINDVEVGSTSVKIIRIDPPTWKEQVKP